MRQTFLNGCTLKTLCFSWTSSSFLYTGYVKENIYLIGIAPRIQEDRVVINVSLYFDADFRLHPLQPHLIEAVIKLQEVDGKDMSENGFLSRTMDRSAIILPRKGSLVFEREYTLVTHLHLRLEQLQKGYMVRNGKCSHGKFRSVSRVLSDLALFTSLSFSTCNFLWERRCFAQSCPALRLV